jgi:hypothetical protein
MIIPKELNLPNKFTQWRAEQAETVDKIVAATSKTFLLDAPTGCHPQGQKILMFDGSVKNVENILSGDVLMGPDNSPRVVESLNHGHGFIWDIIPKKGPSFKVNNAHVLSLKVTKGIYKPNLRPQGKHRYQEGFHKGAGIYGGLQSGDIVNIRVSDYLKTSKWFKHICKLYRVPIDFTGGQLSISPYFLGILLGDGGIKTDITVTTSHEIPEMYLAATLWGVRVVFAGQKGKAKTWRLSIPRGGNAKNPLMEELRKLGLWGTGSGTKFIPQQYKVASNQDRKEILAGLIDTDGSRDISDYDYISKSQRLAEDVVFIARSLGLAAYVHPTIKKTQFGVVGEYYRVHISGDCSLIPSRFKPASERKQKKDVLVTGFEIKSATDSEFFGFTLSGDGRYLLGDFTVTHNSGKSLVGIAAYKRLDVLDQVLDRMTDDAEIYRCLYLTRTIQLQEQILKDFPARMIKGRSNYPCALRPKDFPKFSADDCPGKCPFPCQYAIEKNKTVHAPLAVLNDAYYLTETNGPGQFSGANMVIVDEIDSLESCLLEQVKFSVSERQCKKYGLKPPAEMESLVAWQNWARQAYQRVGAALNVMRSQLPLEVNRWTNTEMDINKEIKTGESFLHRMNLFINEVNDTWILDLENNKFGWQVTFKPVTVGAYGERYLWRHGKRFLGMSGTILDPEIMAEDLGIDDYEYCRLDSTFPVANRIIHYNPVANLKFDRMQEELPKLAIEVASLIKKHAGDNVLVHAVSNNIRDFLVGALPLQGISLDKIMTHNTDNRADQLTLFKSRRGYTMISPSFDRGVDLPDGECKCVIICKMPYMSLGDKQVKARLAMPKGQRWYNMKTIQTVMQMTGRAVRSPTDVCDIHILDRQFDSLLARTRHMLPKWWLEAIRRK